MPSFFSKIATRFFSPAPCQKIIAQNIREHHGIEAIISKKALPQDTKLEELKSQAQQYYLTLTEANSAYKKLCEDAALRPKKKISRGIDDLLEESPLIREARRAVAEIQALAEEDQKAFKTADSNIGSVHPSNKIIVNEISKLPRYSAPIAVQSQALLEKYDQSADNVRESLLAFSRGNHQAWEKIRSSTSPLMALQAIVSEDPQNQLACQALQNILVMQKSYDLPPSLQSSLWWGDPDDPEDPTSIMNALDKNMEIDPVSIRTAKDARTVYDARTTHKTKDFLSCLEQRAAKASKDLKEAQEAQKQKDIEFSCLALDTHSNPESLYKNARSNLQQLKQELGESSFFARPGFLRIVSSKNLTQAIWFARKSTLQMMIYSLFDITFAKKTGMALLDFFRTAGYDTVPLKAYLATRGDDFIECDKIIDLITQAENDIANGHYDVSLASSSDLRKGDIIHREDSSVFYKTQKNNKDFYYQEFQSPQAIHVYSHNSKPIRMAETTVALLDHPREEESSTTIHIIVRESRGALTTEWSIPQGKIFKKWITERKQYLQKWSNKTEDFSATLKIVGIIIPEFQGSSIKNLSASQEKEEKISREDFHHFTISCITNLEKLAKRGIINGQITPEKVFYDRASKSIQCINISDIAEISKNPAKLQERLWYMPQSRNLQKSFIHPAASTRDFTSQVMGFEQDVFSTGMTILSSWLRYNGDGEKASELEQSISRMHEDLLSKKRPYQELKSDFITYLQKFEPQEQDRNAIIAIQCIKLSFDLIQSNEGEGTIKQIDRMRLDEYLAHLSSLKQPAVKLSSGA